MDKTIKPGTLLSMDPPRWQGAANPYGFSPCGSALADVEELTRGFFQDTCDEIKADPKIKPYIPAWGDSNYRDFDAGISAAVAVLIQQGEVKTVNQMEFRAQEDAERRFEYLLKRFIERWKPSGTPTAQQARVHFEADLIMLLRETQFEMHRQGMDSVTRMAYAAPLAHFVVKP